MGREYFEKFEEIINKYLPDYGEGDTFASQAVTAVNKLIYKWFNDGDVYDNTYHLIGWANDLSSYANWLYHNIERTKYYLNEIKDVLTEEEYEEILASLADIVLDEDFLIKANEIPTVGSIYDCDGPFRYSYDEEDEYSDDGEGWYRSFGVKDLLPLTHGDEEAAEYILIWYDVKEAYEDFDNKEDYISFIEDDIPNMLDAATSADGVEVVKKALGIDMGESLKENLEEKDEDEISDLDFKLKKLDAKITSLPPETLLNLNDWFTDKIYIERKYNVKISNIYSNQGLTVTGSRQDLEKLYKDYHLGDYNVKIVDSKVEDEKYSFESIVDDVVDHGRSPIDSVKYDLNKHTFGPTTYDIASKLANWIEDRYDYNVRADVKQFGSSYYVYVLGSKVVDSKVKDEQMFEDSKVRDNNLLGKRVRIHKRYSNLDGTIGTIYSYEGTNYDDKVEVERNGHFYTVNYEDIEFLDGEVEDDETIDYKGIKIGVLHTPSGTLYEVRYNKNKADWPEYKKLENAKKYIDILLTKGEQAANASWAIEESKIDMQNQVEEKVLLKGSLNESSKANYTIEYYINRATADRRPTTAEDVEEDYIYATIQASNDLEALREAFYIQTGEDYYEEVFDDYGVEDTVEGFKDYFDDMDIGDGSTIICKVTQGSRVIYDSGLNKQYFLGEVDEYDEEEGDELEESLNKSSKEID